MSKSHHRAAWLRRIRLSGMRRMARCTISRFAASSFHPPPASGPQCGGEVDRVRHVAPGRRRFRINAIVLTTIASAAELLTLREPQVAHSSPSGQNPLQCPPMHIETAGGLRHVAPCGLMNLPDVLQAHMGRRHGMLWRLSFAAQRRKQRGDDVIRIHRFREIVDGAELYCLYGRRDIAVASQNDGACLGPKSFERRKRRLGRSRHRIVGLPQHIPVRSAEFEVCHRTPIRQSSP